MMKRNMILRNVALAVIGAFALVMKPAYKGPLHGVVYSYGGNFSVSFAIYFIAAISASRFGLGRIFAALATLVAVCMFEATDGFGFMMNTYDPLDYVSNVAGVAFAIVVDLLLSTANAKDAKTQGKTNL